MIDLIADSDAGAVINPSNGISVMLVSVITLNQLLIPAVEEYSIIPFCLVLCCDGKFVVCNCCR